MVCGGIANGTGLVINTHMAYIFAHSTKLKRLILWKITLNISLFFGRYWTFEFMCAYMSVCAFVRALVHIYAIRISLRRSHTLKVETKREKDEKNTSKMHEPSVCECELYQLWAILKYQFLHRLEGFAIKEKTFKCFHFVLLCFVLILIRCCCCCCFFFQCFNPDQISSHVKCSTKLWDDMREKKHTFAQSFVATLLSKWYTLCRNKTIRNEWMGAFKWSLSQLNATG